MVQTTLKLFFMTMITFCLTVPGMALDKNGNSRKGKYLYRKQCRTCHMEGATGDRVGKPLSPISKTQAQWDKAFGSYQQLACADQWKKHKEKDLSDIYSYLWGHAYDSPSPAKCE